MHVDATRGMRMKPIYTRLSQLCLLLLLLGAIEAQQADDAKTPAQKLADDQVEWLRAKGGYFSPKISIRPLFEAESAPLGLFANEAFSVGETIMVIPRKCLLTAGPDSDDMCDTAANLLKEHKLKEASEFAPYVAYLFIKDSGSIPSSWSSVGQELILKIRGDNLPPDDLTDVSYQKQCGDDEASSEQDPLMEYAYRTVVSRAWSDKLVPVYDMVNHHSGQFANVDSTRVHGKFDVKVHATRSIKANEQLFLSYMDCIDETGYENEFVLPQILRDFGFVDHHPQRWIFPVAPHSDENVVFDLDFVNEEAGPLYRSGVLNSPEMKIAWRTPKPTKKHLLFLKAELFRLVKLESYVTETLPKLDSDYEREVTKEYYRSLTTALRYATGLVEEEGTCTVFDDDGKCVSYPATKYGEKPNDWMACDYYKDAGFKTIYTKKSHYQKIEMDKMEKGDDVCLYLDSFLHACASCRPHYHEVFVHYPARFIDQVQRVLFIGGGDSMLLHEILKYPSLELVVGLELDHEINKATFKNFGTQPHWDNPKVQWYYGDAAKSMLVLPREYYGSFDLVLVDILTEVAERLRVNDELNLTEAATLLMKPDGIIVKNEDEGYVPGSKSDFTKYSVDIAFHDVPMYCLQVFVLGSNTVDFLTATPKDHDVETLYLKDLDSFQSHFDSWYNFGTPGSGLSSLCQKANETKVTDAGAGNTSLGALLILEAEHVSETLESLENLRPVIVRALSNAGLSETGFSSSSLSGGGHEGFNLVVYVGESYVAVRCIPLHQYCAFDVQLYGEDIGKLDLVQAELLAAVQSNYSSAYRFVTGGLSVAQQQVPSKIGPPRAKDLCPAETEDVQSPPGSKIRKRRDAADFGEPQFSTLHSYDRNSSLAQWENQRPFGIQVLMQLAAQQKAGAELDLDINTLSTSHLKEAVKRIAFLSAQQKTDVEKGTEAEVSDIIGGDGTAFAAIWNGGNIVGTFDGKSRVDLNIFLLSEATSKDVYMSVYEVLKTRFEHWKIAKFDVIPRGTGSVVILKENMEDGEVPIWA